MREQGLSQPLWLSCDCFSELGKLSYFIWKSRFRAICWLTFLRACEAMQAYKRKNGPISAVSLLMSICSVYRYDCRTFSKNEFLAIKCDQITDRSVTDVSLPCFSNRLSGEVWNLSWEVAWSCRSSFLPGSPLFSQSDFYLVRRCSIFTGISYFFVCRSITGVIKFNIYILNHFRMLALQGHCPLVLPTF